MMLVKSVKSEADEVKSLRLECPDGSTRLPGWTPGAHIEITLPSGLVRQYSLFGDPSDEDGYDIAVLRQENGRGGSVEVHESLVAGTTVGVRGPINRFPLQDAAEYLFIAGGIGITPILPMVREAQRRGVKWKLVYGGRTVSSMAFCELLGEPSQGDVSFVPEDELGLIDVQLTLDTADPSAAVYCCGPHGLISSVERACSERGREFNFERFGANPDAGNGVPAFEGTSGTFEIELRKTGKVLCVAENQSILQVVREVIPDVPSSCEDGFCGSCETKVLGGVPEHHDSILSEFERAGGQTMMICVGRSRSNRLVLDL
ncbi:PDR/VanB family oxidoreductase [Streptomyces sp. NPDC020792]|uniref:PDR/VanB family oxidoreductase n=1 Tax=Streptomyces sp. NPDC020792 TaxID=3365089 RepID=UPI00378F92E4